MLLISKEIRSLLIVLELIDSISNTMYEKNIDINITESLSFFLNIIIEDFISIIK